jgi:zinc D-Ala-D-Ala dipeptidase
MNIAIRTLIGASILILGCPEAGASGETPHVDNQPMPAVDHHVHIFSPEGSRALGLICDVLGPAGCPPQVSHAPSTGDDVIQALDQAGIARAELLSGAYFFASPELVRGSVDLVKGTRDENTFIVAQARAHCDRLIPFVSVNPLASNALEEIAYWGRHGGAAGVKLHLGSAKFSFRDPQQVRKLAAVFHAAAQAHLAIIIHMQTRAADYGAEDARVFLRDVYPRAAGVTVQIAHAAGGGGVDSHQLAALETFARAIETQPRATRTLYFDLAMVPDLFANEGKIAAQPTDVAALEALMHRIGFDRFVLGSDYTPGLDLRAYYSNQRSALGFSAGEWQQLAAQVVPSAAAYRCKAPASIPPAPSAALMRWVGQYGAEDSPLSIYEEGGRLFADGMELHQVSLLPHGPAAYSVQAPLPPNGTTMRIVLEQGRAVAVQWGPARLPRIDVGALVLERFRATRSDAAALRSAALKQTPPPEKGPRRPSDLVDLATDPAIKFDIRYATTNNFMGFALYDRPGAYMQRPAAEALDRAAHALAQHGFGLLVYDAYRPWFVTKMFWDATPESAHMFVANPADGSRHNRGCAVDLTLYRLSTGEPAPMTGRYDEMSLRSYADFIGGTSEQRALRDLLRRAMEAEGFAVYAEEWWHFDYKDWEQYAIGNATFDQLQEKKHVQ